MLELDCLHGSGLQDVRDQLTPLLGNALAEAAAPVGQHRIAGRVHVQDGPVGPDPHHRVGVL